MLVIVENRYVEKLLEALLYLKASWSGYIFKVDSAEGRSYIDNSLNYLLCILCVKADRNSIDPAEFFKKDSLTLHYRHCCISTYVAKTENRTSVGYNSHCVRLDSILVSSFLVLGNNLTWFCNARGICKC